jgi:hypothetical protein
LHANCSHCHRAGSSTGTSIDLRYSIPFASMGVCNKEASHGSWPDGTRVLVPGAPALSLLSVRPGSTASAVRMPQLGTRVVDEPGVAAIDAWIQSISACP